jgi:hypothetical protein
MGPSTQFTQVTSSTREQVLINDQVDMVLATYSITPARAEKISFAGPYYTSQAGVLVKASNKAIQSYNDLAGKKVATQAGSTGPAILAQFAPKAVVQEFQTHQEALDGLRQGRVDAYVTDYTLLLNALSLGTGDARLAGAPFGAQDPYGIGLPKGSDGVAFVNAFLKKMEADGTWAKLWTISIGPAHRQHGGSDAARPSVIMPSLMGEVSRLLADYGPAFGQALLLTWKLTLLSFVPGFLLGMVVTVLRLLPLPPLRFVLTVYVEIFRNIPSVALADLHRVRAARSQRPDRL